MVGSADTPRIAIVGAGFSGMCMAIKLKEAGIHSFTIFEKADNVGGTWRDNTYPGVACDVPSHLYSFSFEPKLDWTRLYSAGAEIQDYCEYVARKYGLLEHIEYGCELTNSTYSGGKWQIEFKNGRTENVAFLVSGIGGLHVPNFPDIEGKDTFGGVSFHSAQWNHGHDLAGKKVAVVGSAASALQLIPEIVGKVASLDMYQRTPNWVMPRENTYYSDDQKAKFQRSPWKAKLHRLMIYLAFESRIPLFKGSKILSRIVSKAAHGHLEDQVADEELRAALTPDFPFGCKRILASDTYFPALQQDHVSVVTGGISKIVEGGIETTDGTFREADTIIYATGFKPLTMVDGQEITGKNGLKMVDYLKDGIRAHRTVMAPGFPNYFMLLGPNSVLGHNSVLIIIEAQAKYILQCIQETIKTGAKSIDVKPKAAERFDDRIQEQLKGTVWSQSCKSWYKDENGRIFTLWPKGTISFRRSMKRIKRNEFQFEH
ncbi:MAG: NAD(P)/FAD-dependent oxidoreductase [Kordiimonadaceae bacterium]|nr:NAD(P)/FAD-dependent oxidoreductase [Kordiimonadaceae bacterium]